MLQAVLPEADRWPVRRALQKLLDDPTIPRDLTARIRGTLRKAVKGLEEYDPAKVRTAHKLGLGKRVFCHDIAMSCLPTYCLTCIGMA